MSDKVCPGCGAIPSPVEGHDDLDDVYCRFCGDKYVSRSELPNDIWKDPCVKEALQSRAASDIAVIRCPKCDRLGYYNEGSTFSCRFCDLTFLVVCEDDEHPAGYKTVSSDEVIRLDDTITVTTDGYDNQSL